MMSIDNLLKLKTRADKLMARIIGDFKMIN